MRLRLLIGAFLVTVATASPAGAQPKYFGYFGSDYIGKCTTECAAETATQTNVVWVYAQVTSKGSTCGLDFEWQCKIVRASSRNQKVVLNILDVLFDRNTMDIVSNWKVRMSTLANALGPLTPNVAALYLVDEPMLQAVWHGLTKDEMITNVQTANAILKNNAVTAPIPIAVTFAAEELIPGSYTELPGSALPWGYDWVGFDCYDVGDGCHGTTVENVVSLLQARMSATQRMFLVPDGFICTGSACASRTEETDRTRAALLYQIAISTPSVIGIFPYVLASYVDSNPTIAQVTGTRDLPALRSDYIQIGQSIISQPTTSIDTPSDGAAVGQNFLLTGWALDVGAFSGNGIDAVHVWAFPTTGGSPSWIGSASMSVARSDVATSYGAQHTNSGWRLAAATIPSGSYTLVAYGHSTVTGTFNSRAVRTITVGQAPISQPITIVDAPSDGAVVGQNFWVGGWAADLGAPAGNGIDVIHVWAFPTTGGSPSWIGAASTSGARPDVAAYYGAQHTNSGWALTAATIPSGSYTLVAYGHSLLTGTFNSWAVRTITVQ